MLLSEHCVWWMFALTGLTERVVVDLTHKRLGKQQLEQIESLKLIQAAARDTQMAQALFHEIDEDGSGQLDEEEFGNLLARLGECQWVKFSVLCALFVVSILKSSIPGYSLFID